MKRSDRFCFSVKARFVAVTLAIAAAAGITGCRSMPQPSAPEPARQQQGDVSEVVARINMEDDADMAAAPSDDPGPREFDGPFPTFRETGLDPCTDDDGRPLILLFSAASCSHCQWVGGAFDLVAREYAERGVVAAHHYDIETGDDLLTETVETRIPEAHVAIGRSGDPDGYLPYFNFGCSYDRIGTGYEEQDDLAAEAEEMCRVIETLLP